ncbi:MAG: hypothetical protein RLZZ522_505 [Verrucomicrobiota bacterium]
MTVLITPHFKGGKIAYIAQFTLSELITSEASSGQTQSETISRTYYVSGVSKDGQEVCFDFAKPSDGNKVVVCLHFKHKAA